MELYRASRVIAAGLAATLGLTACGPRETIQGGQPSEIVDKVYDDDDSEYSTAQGQWDWKYERYMLRLKQCDAPKPGADANCTTVWIKVSEDTYNDFEIGEHIIFESDKTGNSTLGK